MSKLSEKQISEEIVALFKARGLYIQRINTGLAVNYHTQNFMALAEKGHSDYIASDQSGRICFLEIKTPTGCMSSEQIYFLREQHRKKRRWAVLTSYEDAVRFLAEDDYHGAEQHIRDIIDETKRFVLPAHRKNAKMTVSTFLAWNRHQDNKKTEI